MRRQMHRILSAVLTVALAIPGMAAAQGPPGQRGNPNAGLSSDHTDLASEHTGLSGAHTALSGAHTGLTSDHSGLTSEHTGLSGAHTTLTGDHSTLIGAHSGLEEKLDQVLEALNTLPGGVTQNWDKILDSTNGDANGCNSDRFTCIFPSATQPDGAAVRDNETGLVWERSPDPTRRNWLGAIDQCGELEVPSVGGRKGWHVPMREQLASLVDGSNADPALPTDHPFQSVQPVEYWSASTSARSPTSVWVVRFSNGDVNDFFGKVNSFIVWCVRGGQSFDGQDNQQVIDALTP